MAGMNTADANALIRANLWSAQLKDVLYADLMARNYVRWITDFPDGNTLNIPSIGTLDAVDYIEDQPVQYMALDTGNFTFTINNYVSSATYITNKLKQDSFYMSELVGMFVPKEARALAERLEKDVFIQGQPATGNPAGYQLAGDPNNINSYAHRAVGSLQIVNSGGTWQTIGPADFAYAKLALQKANVPQTNLLAIVDPSVEFTLNTLTNIVNVQNNPMWEGVIEKGLGTGLRFSKNIYGFDVYVSNFLPVCGQAQSGASETISGVASGTNALCNIFFSAAQDVLPFVGAFRQMPKVDADYNKDFQREEYVTTSRYGLKIFRPENFVTILSNPGSVVA